MLYSSSVSFEYVGRLILQLSISGPKAPPVSVIRALYRCTVGRTFGHYP